MGEGSLAPGGFPQTSQNRTRLRALQELAEYVGGGNKPEQQARAGTAWDSAVREFNSVAWKFNRLAADVVIDSAMATNVSAPTVTNTGAGTGFTLSNNKTIRYWIEERVKVSNQIVRRNNASAATVVTLTGSGAVVRPVVTRPAQLNPDATHWALFGTETSGSHSSDDAAFPHGTELGETAIATTTIEDLRTGLDPGLITNGSVYQSGEYDLPTDFRNPVRAFAIDGSGQQRYALVWVPYRNWSRVRPWQTTTGSNPVWYTARNVHETGKVTFDPRPGDVTNYPIIRVVYDRRIVPQSSLDQPLDVPMEIDEAIFQLALATFISKVRTFDEGRTARALADRLRMECEVEWRDYEDFS